MKHVATSSLISAAVIGFSALAVAQDRPQIDWSQPVWCMDDPGFNWIRVQCDSAAFTCYWEPEPYTPDNCRLDEISYSELEDKGYRFVQIFGDPPHGWWRDEEGRLFQVAFDMNRRLYLGASYDPTWDFQSEELTHRAAFDMGLLGYRQRSGAYYSAPRPPVRHSFRALEGRVRLDPFEVDGTLFSWDRAQRRNDPLLRITTFFGTPTRHDLYANVTWGIRVGRIHMEGTGEEASADADWIGFFTGSDLWQSDDLTNRFRFRVGPVAQSHIDSDGRLTPGVALEAAVEGHWSIDPSGLNQFGFNATYQQPWVFDPGADQALESARLESRAEFERILLAINDQPVSFVLAAGASHRPAEGRATDLVASTGLRFSLWAPAPPASREQ